MAYRSDLEAALARLDAMSPEEPCPSCARRAEFFRRLYAVVCDLACATSIVLGVLGVMFLVLLACLATMDFSRCFG